MAITINFPEVRELASLGLDVDPELTFSDLTYGNRSVRIMGSVLVFDFPFDTGLNRELKGCKAWFDGQGCEKWVVETSRMDARAIAWFLKQHGFTFGPLVEQALREGWAKF